MTNKQKEQQTKRGSKSLKREVTTSGFILLGVFPVALTPLFFSKGGGRTGKSRGFQEEVTNCLCNCCLSLSTLSSQQLSRACH